MRAGAGQQPVDFDCDAFEMCYNLYGSTVDVRLILAAPQSYARRAFEGFGCGKRTQLVMMICFYHAQSAMVTRESCKTSMPLLCYQMGH